MNINKLYLTPESVVVDPDKGYRIIAVSRFVDKDSGKSCYAVEAVSRGFSTVRIKLDETESVKAELLLIDKELQKQSRDGHEGSVLVNLDNVAFKAWVVSGNAGVSGTATGIHIREDIVSSPFESAATPKTK